MSIASHRLALRRARACLEAACSLSCAEPAAYVRRAAELCASLPAPVPGLSHECAAYVLSHPSNAFDEGVVQVRVYHPQLLHGCDLAWSMTAYRMPCFPYGAVL